MKATLHAVGRTEDVAPYLALGAEVHEVTGPEEAARAVREATRSASLVLVAEEFAGAAGPRAGSVVMVVPGVRESSKAAVNRMRELIARSVGVDLIAKAERTER